MLNESGFTIKDVQEQTGLGDSNSAYTAAYGLITYLRARGFIELTGETRKLAGNQKQKGATLYRFTRTMPATLAAHLREVREVSAPGATSSPQPGASADGSPA